MRRTRLVHLFDAKKSRRARRAQLVHDFESDAAVAPRIISL